MRTLGELDPRYRAILDTCEPFLVSHTANLPALDLAPLGLAIPEERCYTATSLRSRSLVDGLHVLDAATFGHQEMLMPRWVLFDCGEFPGIVFGFGRRARQLPTAIRERYGVEDAANDEAFVPLSMWVAIRCAENGAWFGHNLSSLNVVGDRTVALSGLATLTKIVGIKVARATKQYGATQWDSASLALHVRLGEMRLLSAYTPAHTHAETLAYGIDVQDDVLTRVLRPGYRSPELEGDRILAADDHDGFRRLQDDLEGGANWSLVRVERAAHGPQRLHLCRR